ncbi:CHAT domain-containing protein [Kovacikia minuta]|uniref:CHAT domain-containing protein n=1 Tax=Kovacikia minuta TaxID=2931930 RepID=UPI0020C7BF96
MKIWQQATETYGRAGDRPREIGSRINQAQALKALGNYRLALEILQQLDAEVPLQPPTLEKAQILRSRGDLYRAIGELAQANESLQTSLEVAKALKSERDIGATYLSLGIRERAEISKTPLPEPREAEKWMKLQQQVIKALEYFQQPEATIDPMTKVQAELNQISLLVDTLLKFNNFLSAAIVPFKALPPDFLRYFLNDSIRQPQAFPGSEPAKVKILKDQTAQLTEALVKLLAQDRPQLNQLTSGSVAVNARINFAQSLTKLKQVADSAEQADDRLNALLKAARKTQKQSMPNPNSKTLQDSFTVAAIADQSNSTHSPFLSKAVRQTLRTEANAAFGRACSVLEQAITEAQAIGNKRAEAAAQTALAELYGVEAAAHKQPERWSKVEALSRRAVALAQESNAADIGYRAQWQLARALINQGTKTVEARATCRAAAVTLQSLRRDLVAIDQDVQFTFRDSVDPFYRECAATLLPSEEEYKNQEQDAVQQNLEDARQLIESLQLAELDNFFREACLEGQKVPIDQIVGSKENPKTAFIYSIVLPNQQIGVIAKLPGQENAKKLHYYAPPLLNNEDIPKTLSALRRELTDDNSSSEQIKETSKNVYRWLIQPLKDQGQLNTDSVDTLVFVLDEIFRNIPMAVLSDENGRFLIQDYAIAVSPGLQLVAPKPIGQEKLSLLTAGLGSVPENERFAPLPYIKEELDLLEQAKIVTRSLRDKDFKKKGFAEAINASPFNVVHLATHGEFSSRKEDTFILTDDGRLYLDQFSDILRSRSRNRSEAIELLVLSACRTAEGDNRAALGLAGIALKAGVRSTLASLWTVSDETTPTLMNQFYAELQSGTQTHAEPMTKAKALQKAQLKLLDRSPYYWSPYILVGNWL